MHSPEKRKAVSSFYVLKFACTYLGPENTILEVIHVNTMTYDMYHYIRTYVKFYINGIKMSRRFGECILTSVLWEEAGSDSILQSTEIHFINVISGKHFHIYVNFTFTVTRILLLLKQVTWTWHRHTRGLTVIGISNSSLWTRNTAQDNTFMYIKHCSWA